MEEKDCNVLSIMCYLLILAVRFIKDYLFLYFLFYGIDLHATTSFLRHLTFGRDSAAMRTKTFRYWHSNT